MTGQKKEDIAKNPTPDALCNALSQAVIDTELANMKASLKILKLRKAPQAAIADRERYVGFLEQLPPEGVEFRDFIRRVPAAAVADILAQHGVKVVAGQAYEAALNLPSCEWQVRREHQALERAKETQAMREGIEAIKKKLEDGGHKATCFAADDRISELDPPSVQSIRAVQACGGRAAAQ